MTITSALLALIYCTYSTIDHYSIHCVCTAIATVSHSRIKDNNELHAFDYSSPLYQIEIQPSRYGWALQFQRDFVHKQNDTLRIRIIHNGSFVQ